MPPSNSTPKTTFTTGEVAKFCGVHFRTVIRWIEKGVLKAYQLPGRGDNRVTREDLLDFLNGNNMPIPEELYGDMKDSAPEPDSSINKNTILIVDDDAMTAKLMEKMLRDSGYDTIIAQDGVTAIALVGSRNPGLICLDLKMPFVDGFEVISKIREVMEFTETKILVISSMDDLDLQKADRHGADQTLTKPVSKVDLIETIQTLLES